MVVEQVDSLEELPSQWEVEEVYSGEPQPEEAVQEDFSVEEELPQVVEVCLEVLQLEEQ